MFLFFFVFMIYGQCNFMGLAVYDDKSEKYQMTSARSVFFVL